MPMLRLPASDEQIEEALRLAERGVGGFCVFGGDASTLPDLLRRLRAAAPHPLLIASDLERGAGQQVAGLSDHPPAAALGPAAAEAAGVRTAIEARRVGITMAFAPVCDVGSESRNPIIQSRAFLDPVQAAPRFVVGARSQGLRTCAKHFPGHGATIVDSHSDLPRVDAPLAVWCERDLPPFAAAIAAGVDAVMSAHIACPALSGEADTPATLSHRVMTTLLREEMGFQGLTVTDALLMDGVRAGRSEEDAAALALQAGCDVLLCPEDVDGVLRAAARAGGEASLERMSVASEPLPEPLAVAAERSIRTRGTFPVGRGVHPLRIFALHGSGSELAQEAGIAYEQSDFEGNTLAPGDGAGLERPVVAILRADRAWAGSLALPEPVKRAAEAADAILLFGPTILLEGLRPEAVLVAPGQDPMTLRAAAKCAFVACGSADGDGSADSA
jgi:beta-glucosidase-like glycosyl hydrolase